LLPLICIAAMVFVHGCSRNGKQHSNLASHVVQDIPVPSPTTALSWPRDC
jgi:hypothetical protein